MVFKITLVSTWLCAFSLSIPQRQLQEIAELCIIPSIEEYISPNHLEMNADSLRSVESSSLLKQMGLYEEHNTKIRSKIQSLEEAGEREDWVFNQLRNTLTKIKDLCSSLECVVSNRRGIESNTFLKGLLLEKGIFIDSCSLENINTPTLFKQLIRNSKYLTDGVNNSEKAQALDRIEGLNSLITETLVGRGFLKDHISFITSPGRESSTSKDILHIFQEVANRSKSEKEAKMLLRAIKLEEFCSSACGV